MVHSIELVFDSDTEAAIRRIWAGLAAAGIPSQAPASRPHVSLAVAERIAPEVDEPLGAVARRLPLDCVIGAPVLFGRANVVFTRLVCRPASFWPCMPRCTGSAARTWRPRRWPTACPVSGPPMSPWPDGSVVTNWGGRCALRDGRRGLTVGSPACAAGTATRVPSTCWGEAGPKSLMAKGFDRNFVLMASSRVRAGAGQVARTHVDVGMSKDLRGRRFSRIVVVVLVVVA